MLKKMSKKKFSMKKMKLASKTSVIVSATVVVCFAIFIYIATFLTKGALEKSTSSEFSSIAAKNAARVQATFDLATNVGHTLQEYLNTSDINVNADQQEKIESAVYNVPIPKTKLDIETYCINTIKSLVKNNDEISGGGIFFEPNMFDSTIPTYGFLISENNVDGFKKYPNYSDYAESQWYSKVKETGKVFFSDTYNYEGIFTVTSAYPIFSGDKFVGVCAIDINIEKFSNDIEISPEYETMYASVYSDMYNYCIYSSTSNDYIGANLLSFVTPQEQEVMVDGANAKKPFDCTVSEGGTNTRFTFYPIIAGDQVWWSQNAVKLADLNKDVTNTIIWLVCAAIVSVAVIVILTMVVLRKLIKPIDNVVKAAERISVGDFDITLTTKNEDEIGILTNTFAKTATNLKSVIADISNVLNAIANKNLAVSTSAEYIGELEEIEVSINNIIGNLNIVVGNLSQTSDEVTSGAEQVSSGAQALSQGATEQAASIEELSATISDVAEKIKNNANDAQRAKDTSIQATKAVLDGNEQMNQLLKAMEEISHKSSEIGKIIKTIDDIAFQTNILSLNAAVEAARAGSAGKGFAVVADEVRSLASKSAEAAKNTTSLISGSIEAVERGTKMAEKTAEFLMGIVEGAKKSTEYLEHIAEASDEQAIAISQINQGVEQISAVVQTNSATAEESAAASEELSGQAQTLKDMVDEFTLKEDVLV